MPGVVTEGWSHVRPRVRPHPDRGRQGGVGGRVPIRGIAGVDTCDDVTGPYDVIARATTETVEELGRFVVTRIQMVEGISRTLTCPIVTES